MTKKGEEKTTYGISGFVEKQKCKMFYLLERVKYLPKKVVLVYKRIFLQCRKKHEEIELSLNN